MSQAYSQLRGVIPPMITPFTKSGDLDEKALKELVNFLKKEVDGLFICGSYGSGPLMSVEERKRVAEITVEEVDREIPVIVHVGTTATDTALALAIHAEEIGASRVASVPPFYYHHTEGSVIEHFRKLVQAVDIPVYVYNNPKTVGYPITPELLSRLADVGVFGIKDSSFDLMLLSNFMRRIEKEGFDVVLGTEALFLPASAIGAKAFIPGMGNAFPELMRELFKSCMEGNLEEARKIQNKVLQVRDIMYMGESSVVAVYEMLKMRGMDFGNPRPPLQPLKKSVRDEMGTALQRLGLLEE